MIVFHQSSFEANVEMSSLNIPKFNGVFIRAPTIIEVGDNVETISKFNDEIVAVKQDNILATAFHPELTSDLSLHMYFLNMTNQTKEN